MEIQATPQRSRAAATGTPREPGSVLAWKFALPGALALAAACLALWVAGYTTRGAASAWPRFEDDAFYYLEIARNAASGRGFTMDGISVTNGFQPLWMWLLVAVAWLTSGDTQALFAAARLLVVGLFCLGGGLLFSLLRKSSGLRPALLGMGLLFVPPALNVLLSGMESGVAFLVFVLLVAELLDGGALERAEPRLRDARAGVWLGLLMLARLDAVFVSGGLVAQVLCFGLLRGGGSLGARVLRTAGKGLVLFGPALVQVVPYLTWNVARFGHVMPISGALKTSHSHLGFMPENVSGRWWAVLALIVAGTAVALREPAQRRLGRVLAAVSAGLVAHALHATLYMAWAVFAWHFALFVPTAAIALALIARAAEPALPPLFARAVLVGAALLLVAAQAASISRLYLGFAGATGEAGEWVAHTLPKDALLGMKDSGAFSYFSERGVVNLDGVANSFEFQEALCRGELREYLERHHVGYLVQHAVPGLGDPAVDRFELVYPCHFEGGRDSVLTVRRDQEIYRGARYTDHMKHENQVVIWKLAPEGTP